MHAARINRCVGIAFPVFKPQVNMSTNLRLGYDAASVAPRQIGRSGPVRARGSVIRMTASSGRLSRFIGAALGAGDAAIVIATKAHRDELTLRLQALPDHPRREAGTFRLSGRRDSVNSWWMGGPTGTVRRDRWRS
jgi:hypothetical protein